MIDYEDFHARFVHWPFAELESRPKLDRALHLLCERMPENTYAELPTAVIFAPSRAELGGLFRLPLDTVSIYFSPELEKMDQTESDFTVAREFAHLALRCRALGGGLDLETADKLGERWGYKNPN